MINTRSESCAGIWSTTFVYATGQPDYTSTFLPADIILDSILEDRVDILINTIHMHCGLNQS